MTATFGAQQRALGRAEGLALGLRLAETGDYADGWLDGWTARDAQAALWRAGGMVDYAAPTRAELAERRHAPDRPGHYPTGDFHGVGCGPCNRWRARRSA